MQLQDRDLWPYTHTHINTQSLSRQWPASNVSLCLFNSFCTRFLVVDFLQILNKALRLKIKLDGGVCCCSLAQNYLSQHIQLFLCFFILQRSKQLLLPLATRLDPLS